MPFGFGPMGWFRGYSLWSPSWWGYVSISPPKIHGACVNFSPSNYCHLKGKMVHPMGNACSDFRPLYAYPMDEKKYVRKSISIIY
jgi:hypothetical protein